MIENYESKYFAIGIFHSIYPFIYTDEVFNYLILVYMYNYEGSCVVVLRISNYSVHEIFLLLFCFSCCCHKVLLYLGLSRIKVNLLLLNWLSYITVFLMSISSGFRGDKSLFIEENLRALFMKIIYSLYMPTCSQQ